MSKVVTSEMWPLATLYKGHNFYFIFLYVYIGNFWSVAFGHTFKEHTTFILFLYISKVVISKVVISEVWPKATLLRAQLLFYLFICLKW